MFASNINRQVCMLVCEYTLLTDKVPLPMSLEDRASYCCCWRERRTEGVKEEIDGNSSLDTFPKCPRS